MFQGNQQTAISELELIAPTSEDFVVDVLWSGVSTGTERLLWSGEMPPFPGLSYPLVPGYEAVGIVRQAEKYQHYVGRTVFVPGAHCFKNASGLFGASAARLIVPASRCMLLDEDPKLEDTLMALAATAYHAIMVAGAPDLIVGHGVVGRLLARITMALGFETPTVWEIKPDRFGDEAYSVVHPDEDIRNDYSSACEASGNVAVIDQIIAHARRGAKITLAGFYSDRPSFAFPAAFMREISLQIAAEWTPPDLTAVLELQQQGKLSFDNLITHTSDPQAAGAAYDTAFNDPACLKMVLDWRAYHDNID
ncbi:MAG: chlorophyll synthesis pathway protein BchC [Pseudomonadota bacterium]